jgi:ABC-2 type transport system permease protein
VGKSAFQVLARGIPPVLLGAIAFDLVWPDDPVRWLAFVISVGLASVVGFSVRFLAGLAAFWLLDSRGLDQMVTVSLTFFAGLLLPLSLFPAWLETVARFLPFASMVQLPAEIYLGVHSGFGMASVLAQQLGWALVLLACGRAVLATATRRVVIQGG